jgi:hypothetical protein
MWHRSSWKSPVLPLPAKENEDPSCARLKMQLIEPSVRLVNVMRTRWDIICTCPGTYRPIRIIPNLQVDMELAKDAAYAVLKDFGSEDVELQKKEVHYACTYVNTHLYRAYYTISISL